MSNISIPFGIDMQLLHFSTRVKLKLHNLKSQFKMVLIANFREALGKINYVVGLGFQ